MLKIKVLWNAIQKFVDLEKVAAIAVPLYMTAGFVFAFAGHIFIACVLLLPFLLLAIYWLVYYFCYICMVAKDNIKSTSMLIGQEYKKQLRVLSTENQKQRNELLTPSVNPNETPEDFLLRIPHPSTKELHKMHVDARKRRM